MIQVPSFIPSGIISTFFLLRNKYTRMHIDACECLLRFILLFFLACQFYFFYNSDGKKDTLVYCQCFNRIMALKLEKARET